MWLPQGANSSGFGSNGAGPEDEPVEGPVVVVIDGLGAVVEVAALCASFALPEHAATSPSASRHRGVRRGTAEIVGAVARGSRS
jgi:hypothetical protein